MDSISWLPTFQIHQSPTGQQPTSKPTNHNQSQPTTANHSQPQQTTTNHNQTNQPQPITTNHSQPQPTTTNHNQPQPNQPTNQPQPNQPTTTTTTPNQTKPNQTKPNQKQTNKQTNKQRQPQPAPPPQPQQQQRKLPNIITAASDKVLEKTESDINASSKRMMLLVTNANHLGSYLLVSTREVTLEYSWCFILSQALFEAWFNSELSCASMLAHVNVYIYICQCVGFSLLDLLYGVTDWSLRGTYLYYKPAEVWSLGPLTTVRWKNSLVEILAVLSSKVSRAHQWRAREYTLVVY